MNEASSADARAALVRSLVRAAQNDAPPRGAGARAMARLSADGAFDAAAGGMFGASRVTIALSGAALAAAAAVALAFSHGRLPAFSTPAERLDAAAVPAPAAAPSRPRTGSARERVALESHTLGAGVGGGAGAGGGGAGGG